MASPFESLVKKNGLYFRRFMIVNVEVLENEKITSTFSYYKDSDANSGMDSFVGNFSSTIMKAFATEHDRGTLTHCHNETRTYRISGEINHDDIFLYFSDSRFLNEEL